MASIFWSIIGRKRRGYIPPDGEYLVTRVIDGDSFNITIDGVVHKCRLSGIDTPELEQPWGKFAHQILCELILARHVHIVFLKKGKYKRLICHAYIKSMNVQCELLKLGAAHIYPKYVTWDMKIEFAEAQQYAIINQNGIHSDDYDINPWDYRSQN